MRFSTGDWLRLIAAYGFSSLLLLGALQAGLSFSRSSAVLIAPGFTLILVLLVQPLAVWLVLRRCIGGLDLTPWLLAVALGWVLGTVAHLAAFALSSPHVHGLNPRMLSGDALHLLVLSFTAIAAGIAISLPAGMLLRRLSGVSAWPFVAAGAMSILAVEVAAPTMTRWIAYLAIHLSLTVPVALIMLLSTFLAGMLQGVFVGGGLYLMALQPASADSGRD